MAYGNAIVEVIKERQNEINSHHGCGADSGILHRINPSLWASIEMIIMERIFSLTLIPIFRIILVLMKNISFFIKRKNKNKQDQS